MADSIPSGQGIKTVRLPTDLIATPVGTLRLSEGSSAEVKIGIGRYGRQSDLVRTLLGNGVPSVGLVITLLQVQDRNKCHKVAINFTGTPM